MAIIALKQKNSVEEIKQKVMKMMDEIKRTIDETEVNSKRHANFIQENAKHYIAGLETAVDIMLEILQEENEESDIKPEELISRKG